MTSYQAARGARLPRFASKLGLGVACAGLAAPLAAFAQQAAPATNDAPEVQAVVVTASKGRASIVAPVTSSLNATEPEAVITRKFIEESAPRVGDFTTTAILAPSLSTTPNPNGPGATDGAKLTLRGFADGSYNVTYDGIPWGDTNGPSHHSNSFFPSSTIGGIVVDRGPGKATQLGQATFGGSVNLFSLPLEDRPAYRQTFTLGSFDTHQAVTTVASGPIAALHDFNVVANFMEYDTAGYLTHSDSLGQNQFIKGSLPLTSKLTLSALFTHNYDAYYQGDSNSTATVAQTEAYGKRFALSADPTKQTYYGYNHTKKNTDFEYIRLDGHDIGGFNFYDQVYSYTYRNITLSANNNGADDTLGAAALAKADKVTLTPTAVYPAGGASYPQSPGVGLPGYYKRNQYRVTGNVFQADKVTAFGTFTAGVWYEAANTQRSRIDIDLLTGLPDYREKAALFPSPSGCAGYAVQVAPGKTYNGTCQVPLNIAYLEYTGWRQYEPFAQFEWKPTDKLTITPGVKYVNFNLFFRAPAVAVKGSIQPLFTSNTYEKTLPFLTANYRVRPNWSVYVQYAQGFLVPNISALYVNQPQLKPVAPQESTNYQIGTVYSAGRFTVDADLYYIDFQHKIQSILDLTTNETYETNSGGAEYKGIEVQGTAVLPHGFSVFANGSLNDAIGKDDPVNPLGNGKQLAKAPEWTAALGLRYERRGLMMADDALIATFNTKFIGQQYSIAASQTSAPTGRINEFDETNLSATYHWQRYALEMQILNLLDHQNIVAASGGALITGADQFATTSAQGGAANVFTYQAGRSAQFTLKVAF